MSSLAPDTGAFVSQSESGMPATSSGSTWLDIQGDQNKKILVFFPAAAARLPLKGSGFILCTEYFRMHVRSKENKGQWRQRKGAPKG